VTRVALVGAGIMGTNHARVLHTLPGAQLTVVVDPDEARGRALAASVGATYLPEACAVPGAADAAVLASSSETHADIGVPLLEAGLDLLVEKPLATTVAAADRLIRAAADNDRILMVGHIERFNPAVLELDRQVQDLVHIDLTRMGPFSPRVTEDVVVDLMIHDLELALAIAGAEVERVSAMGQCVRSDSLDLVTALLRFTNGVTATVTASRVAQTKIRQIQLTQRANFVAVDLLRQDVTVHHVEHNEYLSAGGARYRQAGVIEIPFLEHRGEPLGLELGHFLECVVNRSRPRVPGEQGRRAVELALTVRDLADPRPR